MKAITLLCALILTTTFTTALHAGSVTIGGNVINYTASPGTIDLKKPDGSPRGSMFYTAYTRSNVKPKELKNRPIAFVFNGGPGSSSAWLHLGAFGPKRLVLGDAGLTKPERPYRSTENEYSLIDVADLVFIDPIGTGFSRGSDLITTRTFYGFRPDVRSVAEFIKRYLDQEKRTTSPCILIGESYGAMRACGLAPELEEKHGIVVNGIVLISGPIDMGKRSPADLLLPTAAATAHYHGLLSDDLQALNRTQLLLKVDDFVKDSYRPALDNDDLDPETFAAVQAQVLAFTGLKRINQLTFSMRDIRVNATIELDTEAIGSYDTRITSNTRQGRFRGATNDPAIAVISEPMESVITDYLTRELNYTTDLDYRLLNRINLWSHYGSNASDTLTRAFKTNRGLQIFVACGYYDTVTPMAVVRRAVEDAEMTPEQRQNIQYKNYEGGHMMYTNLPSLEELSKDLHQFIRTSSKRKRGPALIPISTQQPS